MTWLQEPVAQSHKRMVLSCEADASQATLDPACTIIVQQFDATMSPSMKTIPIFISCHMN